MTDKILAWHFCREDMQLGYGDERLIVTGETLSVTGPPVLCQHGLHGSERVIDALSYAPGFIACRVEIWGDVIHGDDKLVGTHRRTLYAINAKPIILEFAKWCALQVIDKWDAPPLVIDFLNGDDSHAAADAADAADAAYTADAARAADAARSAARAAADAATYAAGAATYAADAARAAADAAADAAAYGAWDAGDAAAYGARSAAYATAYAGRSAAYAARAAARADQNEKLAAMIRQAANLQL